MAIQPYCSDEKSVADQSLTTYSSPDRDASQSDKRFEAHASSEAGSPTTLVGSPISDAGDELQHRKSAEAHACAFPLKTDDLAPCIEQQSPTPAVEWRPSFFRIIPLMGLAALTLAVLQIIASYAVLAASDGEEIANWNYEPNVYLATLVAVSNKAITFAVVQGTVVTFWLRALKGTTIAQLHRDWSYGLHVYKAICAGRNFSLVALACIFSTLVIIDGPLLQRASTVHSDVSRGNITLEAHVIPELPAYLAGTVHYLNDFAPAPSISTELQSVVRDWTASRPIDGFTGCTGTCTTSVHGPALMVDSCSTETSVVNFSKPLTPDQYKVIATFNPPGAHDTTVFATYYFTRSGLAEEIQFTTKIAQSPGNSSCSAVINTTTCSLVSAVAEYEVRIVDGGARLDPQPYPPIVARANNTAITNSTIAKYNLKVTNEPGVVRSTLSGIAWAAAMRFEAFEVLYPVNGAMEEGSPTHIPFNLFGFQHTFSGQSAEQCIPTFTDPRDEVMASLNELMFRASVHYSKIWDTVDQHTTLLDEGIEVWRNVSGQVVSTANVFRTDYKYFGAAAVVELITVCAVLVTFWGWWRLGRNVSLSPIETAKAFDAPLLRHVGNNLNGRQIAKIENEHRVRYGVVYDSCTSSGLPRSPEERLIIAESAIVSTATGPRLGAWELFTFWRTVMLGGPSKRKQKDTHEVPNEQVVA